jgi:hypothetical protein
MHRSGPYTALFPLSAVMLLIAVSAHAQSAVYAGGSLSLVTQTHPTTITPVQPPIQPGGTTWGGSLLIGRSVSTRLSAEFEPLFVGSLEGQYTYSPNRSFRAHVITRRRDTFFTVQLRARTGFVEPVVGVSYVQGAASRHATIIESSRPYFDDRRSHHGVAVAGGIDGGVKLASRFFFVPSVRAFVIVRPTGHVIGEQTRGGRFAFRYGAGARVTF